MSLKHSIDDLLQTLIGIEGNAMEVDEFFKIAFSRLAHNVVEFSKEITVSEVTKTDIFTSFTIFKSVDLEITLNMLETPKLEFQKQFIHTHPFPLYVHCLRGGYLHRVYTLMQSEDESSNVYARNLVSGSSDNTSPWVKHKGLNLQLAMVQSFKPGDQYCLSPLAAHDFSLYFEIQSLLPQKSNAISTEELFLILPRSLQGTILHTYTALGAFLSSLQSTVKCLLNCLLF